MFTNRNMLEAISALGDVIAKKDTEIAELKAKIVELTEQLLELEKGKEKKQ